MKRVERDIIRFNDGFRARRTIFIEGDKFFAKRFGDMVEIIKDSFGVWREAKPVTLDNFPCDTTGFCGGRVCPAFFECNDGGAR